MNRINFIILIISIIFYNNTLKSEWKLVAPSDVIYKVQSISCPDSNNCFALIDHPSTPVLYKSTDQGRNWFLIYENDIKRYPALVEGVSPDAKYYFFIEDTYLNLWKSNDSGYTFQLVQIGSGFVELSNLSMWDSHIGFVTDQYSYYTTTDGWETFERHPELHKNMSYESPIFIDSNTIVMSSSAKYWDDSLGLAFVKYHLNEDKWELIYPFGIELGIWYDAVVSIDFINDSLGYGCGWRGDNSLPDGEYYDIIYKTTDGGNNWELIYKELVHPEKGFFNISFADEKNGVAVGYWGKIAMTNDGGNTWVYEEYPNEMKNCRKMLVCWAGHTPLIGTWDAGIFRYEGDIFDFPDDTTGVEDRYYSEIILRPNPVYDYLYISNYQQQSRIEIFSIYGIIVLKSEIHNKINVSFLPSGIYFVKIGIRIFKFVKY